MNMHNKENILHIKAIFVTIVLLVTTCSVLVGAESTNATNDIIKTYSFDMPQINKRMINDKVYDQIMLTGCSGVGDPGEPNLPAYGANLLLFQGTEITDIKVTTGKRVFLGSGFNVEPIGAPVKLSEISAHSVPIQNEDVYRSEHPFPGTLFKKVGAYNFRGYEILVLLLSPVQYIPGTGEIYYFEDMTVVVQTAGNQQISPLFRNLNQDELEVMKKVDNPLAVHSYAETTPALLSENYDLLILTTDELKENFEPLKDAHNGEGIATEIKTLSDVSIFPGSVTSEDIRDFIREEYTNSGIEYVLIGGDDDVIPAKSLWVSAWTGGDTTFMPSDLYYACLDGTYNYDDDNMWGEPDDGEDGNDVDLIAEVYLGRACVGSTTEVDNFVEKTISYINSGGYSDGNVLMVGEYLWEDPDTWGGDYMDEMIDGSSVHYTTVGISSSEYAIDTLYDRDYPGNDWPKSEIMNRINDGARIINHLGHSSYTYNMRMVNDDVSSLSNPEPCFIYSQGCMAGGFDNGDCIAEAFTVKTDSAAFAVIMNARYGWGVVGGTDGASQRFHRQFWDAVFGEEIPEIGKANHDSKEDNLNHINGGCMRWCYYETNLLGDPTLAFYEDDNTAPTKPVVSSGARFGRTGIDYFFKATASADPDGDEIYYKWDFGDGTFSEWLGPFEPDEDIRSSNHNFTKSGIYKIRIKARDEHRDESEWSDPMSMIMWKFPLLMFLYELIEGIFN